jgi:hypothetical protein
VAQPRVPEGLQRLARRRPRADRRRRGLGAAADAPALLPALRDALRALAARRDDLLAIMAALPRAVCHLDVWPNNLVRRADGEVVFLDWAFCGDGALGEDPGNLVPDSVFDLLLPADALDDLAAAVGRAYVEGLRDAGWTGDERLPRLGMYASAIKYDWLIARCLEDARADEHRDYGGADAVDPDARYAARAAGLALCARWAEAALRLAPSVLRE